MLHITKFLLLLLSLLFISNPVYAIFEPFCSRMESLNLFPYSDHVRDAIAQCNQLSPSQLPRVPANAKGVPQYLPDNGPGSVGQFCTVPFAVSGTAILRVCPPSTGGGQQGIVWGCKELQDAVARLLEACKGNGNGRTGSFAELDGERGWVLVGTA